MNCTFFGAVPCSPIFLPSISPLVKTGVMLSNSLIRLASMPCRLPEGATRLAEKYSMSSRSKVLGCVTARRITSSVTTGMYSMVMPRSCFTLAAISALWFTAVPR